MRGNIEDLHQRAKSLFTLPVRRGVGMNPQRFFEDNSAQDEPKLAKFLPI